MNIVELQNNIIRRVLDTDDDQLLNYLNQILQKSDSISHYELTDFEKSVIQESMQEYAQGNTISHEDIDSRNKKWLEE